MGTEWIEVSLKDICYNRNTTCKDFEAESIERFVGLEHIEPENLHISSWGLVKDGTTFTKMFYPGQVLFGKRRSYQKKAAVADFKGVCSGDILVFEANKNVIIPELLPFVIQNDRFFDYAVGTSSGSLSPRTSWNHLSNYKLFLPKSKQLQEKVFEKMSKVEHAILQKENLLLSSFIFKEKLMKQLFTHGIGHREFKKTEIGEVPQEWDVKNIGSILIKCQYGLSMQLTNEITEYPVLRMNNLQSGLVDVTDLKYASITRQEANNYILEKDDILFNRTNSEDLVGKTSIFKNEGTYIFASYLIRLRGCPSLINQSYLNYYMNSQLGQTRIRKFITSGVSQSNINATNLKKVLLPVPTKEEQHKISSILSLVDEQINSYKKEKEQLVKTKKTLQEKLLYNSRR